MTPKTPATNPVMEAATCATIKNDYKFISAANIYSVGGAANAHPAVVAETCRIIEEIRNQCSTLTSIGSGAAIGACTAAAAGYALLGNLEPASCGMAAMAAAAAAMCRS